MAHTLFFKLPLLAFILASTSWYNARAQLSPNFYNTTCPNLTAIVRANMTTAIQNNPRMGASILRLHFHDCFVQGCDASVLLDSGGEKTAAPNNNSLLGFDVIDTIKATVESQCGARVVSCADILALAAREGTVLLGGPSWVVGLGRRDSLTGNAAAALTDLPPPNFNLSDLRTAFTNKGLDLTDLVALSGAHTIGQSQCLNFRDRLTNDTNIDPMFRGTRNATCNAGTPDTNLAPLDVQTPNSFDNAYYQNLMQQRGLLHSDQELFNNGTADALVRNYSTNSAQFFADFANAMVKMSTISVLTGTQGQIRGNCRVVN